MILYGVSKPTEMTIRDLLQEELTLIIVALIFGLFTSTIRKFMIPDADKLYEQNVEDLLKIFDKYREIEFPSIIDQLQNKFGPRVEIDKAILRVLGFGDDEINRILDYLYPALANEIQQPINTHARITY